MLNNNAHNYGLMSQLLHWLMLPLVWGLFALGLYMTSLDYYHPWYHAAPWWHKSLGLLTLFLLGIRLCWALIQSKPQPLIQHNPWEVWTARITHILLYLLLILICISGYFIATLKGEGIDFFGLFELSSVIESLEDPDDWIGGFHLWAAVALMILSLLHAGAALKHHFVDKDATLKRMIGW